MTGSAIDEDLGAAGRLQGRCAPGFEAVLDAFRANFIERREVGATVCVMRHGDTVVDLWGGIANPKTGKAWEQDTVSIVFSCTTGATALCAHMLADAGKFAYHDKVTTLWPAFGQGGKGETTIEMMLSHTSPVPHLRDPIRPGGLADWDYMVERVAAEEAHWEPGTRQGYHGLTFAWTVGNIVRLAAGEPMAEYSAAMSPSRSASTFTSGCPSITTIASPRWSPPILPRSTSSRTSSSRCSSRRAACRNCS